MEPETLFPMRLPDRWVTATTPSPSSRARSVRYAVSKPLSETAQLLQGRRAYRLAHRRVFKGICFSAEEETSHANDLGFGAGRSGAVGNPSKRPAASGGAASL